MDVTLWMQYEKWTEVLPSWPALECWDPKLSAMSRLVNKCKILILDKWSTAPGHMITLKGLRGMGRYETHKSK